ncbi:hypothetical protein BGZ49_000618 [Haplosporangium sp. Z 27]|nr:hypothetical protein BGZ49_000618 [Haplosporangium sp. Z 27]
MSQEEKSSTLNLEGEINELPEDQDSQLQDIVVAPVKLVSLRPFLTDIVLKERKTILGRDKERCSEGAILIGSTISGIHCEITSRSMSEAEAVIWIKDVSTNGVWVNEKKIPKDEPVKIFHRDIISFMPGSTKDNTRNTVFMLMDTRKTKRANDELASGTSVNESEPETKKQKLDEESTGDAEKSKIDSSFEKEFECGICHDIMYKALALQPCLHQFCKGCCKAWFQKSSECPSCRQKVVRTKHDFRLNNLISLFIKSRPELQRDDVEDDGAQSDSSNIIKRNGNRDYDDDDDDDDDDDEDSDSDGGYIGQGLNFVPLPILPPNCPCCDPNNNLGYVCPDAVRIRPLPAHATHQDYYLRRQMQPGHTQCRNCRMHLPSIPSTAQASVINRFRCEWPMKLAIMLSPAILPMKD